MARLSNPIRGVSDIPSWFSLSNYDFLAELDSAGWYEQLFAREQLFLMLSYRKNSKRPFSEEDLVYRAAVEIWDKAYISLKDSTVLSAMCGHDGANGRVKSEYAKSIHSLTYRQYLQQEEQIRDEAKEKANQWWENISSDDFDVSGPNLDLAYEVVGFIDLPLYKSQRWTSSHAIADVDLRMV